MLKTKIGKIATKVGSGATPKGGKSSYKGGKIALIRSQNVRDMYFDYSGLAYINDEQAKILDNVEVHSGDILFNITGDSIARCCVVPDDVLPARVNQHVAIIRIPSIDSHYIMYELQFLKNHLLSISHGGSSRNAITKKELENVDIRVPENAEDVSKLLDCLASMVSNNNAIAQQLEAMVKTIYDYWFLQFEFPNEEGKPYKSSGGKMVWNEELQREIPAGWSIKNMGDFIDVVRGVSYSPKDVLEKPSKNSVSLLKSNNIQDNTINLDSSIYLDRSKIKENQYLDKGSVFITMSSGSKAHMGKTAIIYKSIKYTYGAFCAKIIVDRDYNAMISLFFTSSYFRKYIEQVTSGTSINNISVNHLQAIEIPVPPIEVSQKFNEIVEPFYDELGNVFEQNQKLQSLRDFLLPLLMNGQVSVGNSNKL